MGRNWAITIGINQYNVMPSLRHAKRDAEAMRNYFLKEAEFERVFHFTDDSSPISTDWGGLTFPSQPTIGNLELFLDIPFGQPFLDPGDNLWFFFAGHGLRHENRDYLLPSDANPNRAERAISIHYVAERLRHSGADNIVLILDACRDCGNRNRNHGGGIGLEQQQGVVTFFSCSPNEISCEIDELQHGSFTYTLLKGLRGGEGTCATVEQLYEYLRLHVPQLNRRYNKPTQTPYGIVEPVTKSHLILFPQRATPTDIETLKSDARNAELKEDYVLARQLWIRVLDTSPDSEAIEGIERLAKSPLVPYIPSQSRASIPKTADSDSQSQSFQKNIEALRTNAQKSELNQDYLLARHFWIQLLALSLADPEAIIGLERLARIALPPRTVSRARPKPENNFYTKLQHALDTGNWREADRETYLLMLQAVGRKPKELGWLRQKEIPKLHHDLICTIDQLWTSYSNNQFGFTTQQRLWQEVGGQAGIFDVSTFEEFGNEVGWRNDGSWLVRYDNFCFSLAANEGHLPSIGFERGNKISWWNDWRTGFENIFPHIHNCLLKCPEG